MAAMAASTRQRKANASGLKPSVRAAAGTASQGAPQLQEPQARERGGEAGGVAVRPGEERPAASEREQAGRPARVLAPLGVTTAAKSAADATTAGITSGTFPTTAAGR